MVDYRGCGEEGGAGSSNEERESGGSDVGLMRGVVQVSSIDHEDDGVFANSSNLLLPGEKRSAWKE